MNTYNFAFGTNIAYIISFFKIHRYFTVQRDIYFLQYLNRLCSSTHFMGIIYFPFILIPLKFSTDLGRNGWHSKECFLCVTCNVFPLKVSIHMNNKGQIVINKMQGIKGLFVMFPINMSSHNTFSVQPGNFLFVNHILLFWKALPEFNQTGVLRRFLFLLFVRLHTLYCEFCKLVHTSGSPDWRRMF